MTLRNRLIIMVICIIAGIAAPLSVYTISQTHRARGQEALSVTSSIASMLADIQVTAITSGQAVPPAVLDQHIGNAMKLNKSIAYIVILDHAGAPVAGRLNKAILDVTGAGDDKQALRALASDKAPRARGLLPYSVELNVAGVKRGEVKVAFDIRPFARLIERDIAGYAFFSLVLVGAGVWMAILFAGHISRPIEEIAGAMKLVENGNFDARVPVRGRDEVGRLAATFNMMNAGLKEKEWLRNTFTKYVSKQVADEILRKKSETDFEGELRHVSVLFCDMRGFTTLSENLPPKELIRLLNDYFKAIVDIIFKYEGTIDKFVGDQIMVIYGAPLDQDNTALRAVRTAVEIQNAVYRLNQQREREKMPIVNVGIGINSGEVVAGNVGTEQRTNYTVIGDEVNLAQRIESQSPMGEILISANTYSAVKNHVSVEPLGEMTLKGKGKPVEVFKVVSVQLQT